MTRPIRCALICVLLCFAAAAGCHAASVRSAVWAGQFYPATPEALSAVIEDLLRQATEGGGRYRSPFPDAVPRAIVLPHAGYVYSGITAAHGLATLPAGGIDKVILMGPDHRVGLSRAAVSDVDGYETPLGRVPLHPDARALLTDTDLFQYSPASDRMEHSLEVVLPYLQQRLGRFSLVPVVVGQMDPQPLARRINRLLDDRTLLVVSSDLSHFLPYEQAVARDKETLALIRSGNAAALMHERDRACGSIPLAVLLEIARERGWQPSIIHYSNSGDSAGTRERVVGYAAVVFYGGSSMGNLTVSQSSAMGPDDGQALVALARQTIKEKLGLTTDPESSTQLEARLRNPIFHQPGGTFVTLKKKGQLRGCIGTLSARQPLKDDVAQNAINAAFRDPRFKPLTAAEFNQVDIEVSVLSDPQPLFYDSAEDLVKKLRPGVDGVIIQKGMRRATFLPQVWDQLPTHKAFLGHLCLKAGLPESAWKDGELEVSTYQVTYFEAPHSE
ncbi:MAG: AmmeMemoRadiSam system protein B [Pseudomonadota bacterium]